MLTWAFVALSVVYIGLLLADIGVLAAADTIVDRAADDPASMLTAASARVLRLGDQLNSLTLVWIWVYLAGFIAWTAFSRRRAQRLGYDRRQVLRHWTFVAWRLSLVLVFAMSLVVANRKLPANTDMATLRDAFIGHSHALMGYTAVRIAMIGLLSSYVIIVWRRLTDRRPAEAAAA
ncbi:hypothetical protein AB0M46_10545 [Dactylosporangium sp. NPDC051485]|uniref:hypothetical protein n=1 Tax=Dactylosporangium sp. NPDC051485 TaxID=3154846 RepID=UPI00341EC45D